MKAISYALFGGESVRHQGCFPFSSYLRGLMLNIRLNRLVYPEWTNVISLDTTVYEKYKDFFDNLNKIHNVKVNVYQSEPLTKSMLWRLKPIFERVYDKPIYTHVICRDLDSPSTYRDAQAVEYWISTDKACHAITDSISHDVPLLGGMIGFIPRYFTMRTGFNEWNEMFNACSLDFNNKGADQTFLTQFIYPKFAQHGNDSIVQHYLKGMPYSFLSDCHTQIQDIKLNIPDEMKQSNDACVHLGQSGWSETGVFNFLSKYKDRFLDILEIEQEYPIIFHWVTDKSF